MCPQVIIGNGQAIPKIEIDQDVGPNSKHANCGAPKILMVSLQPFTVQKVLTIPSFELPLADLLLFLDDWVLFNVSNQTIAKGLWENLIKLYKGKSISNEIFL